MKNFILNLKRWYKGWSRFAEITEWKDGWGPKERKWYLLYGIDYLACVLLLAGPVVSVSWYLGKYFNFPGSHFANAGEPLWDTVRSPPWVRIAVPVFWFVAVPVLIWSLVK